MERRGYLSWLLSERLVVDFARIYYSGLKDRLGRSVRAYVAIAVFRLSAGDRLPSVPAPRGMQRETVRVGARARVYPRRGWVRGLGADEWVRVREGGRAEV